MDISMDRKGYIACFVLFPMVILSSVLISGCMEGGKSEAGDTITPADSPKIPERGFYMGVLPVPGDGQSFEEAYIQASMYAEFSPVWGKPTPFYRLADDLSGSWGQTFVEGYIRGNGMFPVIQISFIGRDLNLVKPPGMEEATLSDPEWRNAYKQAVLDVVKTSRPLYISVGNEVNRWYEKYGMDENNPNGFQHYISLYEEIYDSVKEISPETKVFCTFAREIVKENREADLSVLAMFNPEKLDVIVFTSYPYAVKGIRLPSDIPDDYYSVAMDYFPDKPFGLIEFGWPSHEAFGGEKAQAEVIKHVTGHLTRDQGMDLILFGWSWLHDLDKNDYVGLIKKDGTEKPAYEVWKNISTGEN